MRKKTLAIAALAASGALVLSACGSDDGSGGDSKPEAKTSNNITVTGEPGAKPDLTIPDTNPSKDLVVDVIDEGDGAEVKKGDILVSNYFLQTWDPKDGKENEIENSWDTGQPAAFPIGEGQVIKGWDEGLVGQKVGSRVAITAPPDMAYGEVKDSDLKKDTLVFIVDILAVPEPTDTASGKEVSDVPAALPKVTSQKNGQPKIDLANAKKPTKSDSTLILEGDGDEVGDGIIVNMAQASYPDGKDVSSSWDQGQPLVLPSAQYSSLPGLQEALDGAKVGSRIVSRISAKDNVQQDGTQGAPLVIVLDVIDTYNTSA